MKKFLLLATAALMLFACNKEDEVSIAKKGNAKFYAIIETTTPGTKVYTDEDLKVLWNAGDQISIFNKTTANDQYEFDGGDGANAGGFNPVVENTGGSSLDYVYAVYPFSKDNAINEAGSEITVNLPSEQAYREQSFGLGANTMVAVANDNKLCFKNACGYLKFRFYGDNVTVKSVSIEGNNGEKISGKAILTPVFGSTPNLAMQSDATEKITIDCEQPVTLATEKDNATEFIFVIPKTTFSRGIKVTVTDVNGAVLEKATTKELVIPRNKMERMSAMKIEFKYNKYELCKSTGYIESGDYVLAYHNGEKFNLFSFTKTMANAEAAAESVKDVHGLSDLLAQGSQIYATVLKENYVTVAGEALAEEIEVPENIEAEAKLSVTGDADEATLTLVSGDYSLRLDKVITSFNSDYSATLAVQPNAPDALNIMYKLRGGTVVITFNDLLNFAITEAEKEGVTFSSEQIDRLRSGFLKLCKLAKEELAEHNMGNLMDIDWNTNVFEVISKYYDNAATLSLSISEEKKFGWATPIGFYKGDDGFTANIALPQAGWFDRIEASLDGDTDAFINYWKGIDTQYGAIYGINGFFERLARKFVNEVDPSTYELLQQVKFSAIGRVYGKYANRFNDQLEKVYLYKKVTE